MKLIKLETNFNPRPLSSIGLRLAKKVYHNIVWISLPAGGGGGGGGGVEPPTKFSKREGFTESQFLEGVC